ncbi:MAG: type I DNA topoisomerase [Kiritimatiellae bacterium]|nr:type I DNA topoisomerase [Kiritimatiellia bacterium]
MPKNTTASATARGEAHKKLVIVESPAKAKTIGKILGSGYIVKPSVGHIRDLPERTLGVDIEHGFEPKYVISPEKKKVVGELKKAAKGCDAIYLASDPDREGEAIAWHLQEVLQPTTKAPFYRVQYNEITPRAVHAAFDAPGTINMNRANAQQARRILDRIVGYRVSPLLWRQLKKGLSAGRVQSVALRLVVEREKQIQAFVPQPYWVMGAEVRRQTEPLDPFTLRLTRIDNEKAEITTEEQAKQISAELNGTRTLTVKAITASKRERHALPPFITSTLQQAASSVCKISPNKTMSLAQKLYEGIDLDGKGPVGLITYMRTDSVNIAQDARHAAKTFISARYGANYFADNYYKSNSNAQEAHECIRPTDITRTPESVKNKLEPMELRLYELIWKRFTASLMASAIIDQKAIDVEPVFDGVSPPVGEKAHHLYQFRATTSAIAFDGFLKVMALDIRKKKNDDDTDAEDSCDVDQLPPLETGMPLDLINWLNERKETKPPTRYSEATLIKTLESNGVGRPSTYASIIETLKARKYTSSNKDRQVAPTELGLTTLDLLLAKLPELFEVGFTAKMETLLDDVEAGKKVWTEMLQHDFYQNFCKWMDAAKEPPADESKVETILSLLKRVTAWGPVVKRGKRNYSDEHFVQSVCEQREAGEKPISDKQLAALANIAIRYRGQIPGAEEALAKMGFGDELEKDKAAPSNDEAIKRFKVLEKVELSDSQTTFVASLKSQVQMNRHLSERQIAALDRIIFQYAERIPDFDAVKTELNLGDEQAEAQVDTESPILIRLLGQVTKWQPATTRGKRTFNDEAFFKSLYTQFEQKRSFSPRQRFAMKRMITRYKAQIKEFAQYAEQLGLRTSKSKAASADAQE